jgi:alanine dehydrogenase
MAVLLRESDVEKLADMKTALGAVEEAFQLQGRKEADNAPRRRCRLNGKGLLHVMSASLPSLGYAGLKSYTSIGGKVRFFVHLYNASSGDLLAIIEADLLGQIRTGAASGVATKYMAREDASRLGIFGTGWQARSQVEAVCAVRPVESVVAFSRSPEHRDKFAAEMTQKLGIPVRAASAPEEAAREADIIVTATTSKEPVLQGSWIAPGTHINAVGANQLSRRELDVDTIRRSACVVVDSLEQSMLESGDLAKAAEEEAFYWEDARDIGLVVVGEFPGREDASEITIFKSNGIALEDIALAGRVYEAALKSGAGQKLPV